jgi:hypothetical protein
VQKITDAAAKPMGMAAGNVPPALAAKLPLEFKQLGHSVHQDFDASRSMPRPWATPATR